MQTVRMKKFLLAFVLLATSVAALPVQSPKGGDGGAVAARPASKIVNADQLLEDVRTLSADDMEGRGAGTQGGARARAYIIRRFDESGLKPLWSSYEQPFELGDEGAKARKGTNVVGYLRGRNHPENPCSYWLFGLYRGRMEGTHMWGPRAANAGPLAPKE